MWWWSLDAPQPVSTDLVLQSSALLFFCECWYVFHDSGELKTLNEWPCFKFINLIITILEWFSFESLSHRFQSSWIFAARRGGGSNPRCVVAPVVVRSNPPGVAGGSCCTPVGCLPCGVETWSRDMYSTAFGAIKTFMSQSFYTQIGKNMLDHSLRSLRSYNFTMICCHHEPRAVLSIKNLSILSEVIIPMPLNLRLVLPISPVKMPKLSDVKAFKELLPIDTCRIWSEQDTGCQLELWF